MIKIIENRNWLIADYAYRRHIHSALDFASSFAGAAVIGIRSQCDPIALGLTEYDQSGTALGKLGSGFGQQFFGIFVTVKAAQL